MTSTFNAGVDTFTGYQQCIYFEQDVHINTITVKLHGNAENSNAYLTMSSPVVTSLNFTSDTIDIGKGDKTVTFTINQSIISPPEFIEAQSRTLYINIYLRGTNFSVYGGAVSDNDKLLFQGAMVWHSPDYKSKIWNSQYDVTNEKVCAISGDTPRLINNSGEDWTDWARDSEGYPFNITVPKINAELNDRLPFFFLMDGMQPITSRLYYNGVAVPLYYNGEKCKIMWNGT